jgi:hypothetical protein
VETETAPAEPSTEVEGQATEPTTSNQLPTEDTPPPREEQPPEAEAADTQVSDSPAPEESAPTETAPLPSTLTAERIFRVLLEECLKDGKISQAENRAIQQIRQILQIPTERHQLIAHTVQADYKSGALRGSEDMNPLSFFEKICRIALKGSGITSPEQILLQVMATYLHITREEFQEIRIRIRDNP